MKLTHAFALIILMATPLIKADKDDFFDWDSLKNEMQKEVAQAEHVFQETMNMLNTAFSSNHKSGLNDSQSLTIRPHNDSLEIIVEVPYVEDSEMIQAVDSQGKLKIKVPQKNMKTTLIIDEDSVTKITKYRTEQKNTNNNAQSYYYTSGSKTTSETLPFKVNLKQRSIEYNDDSIHIKLGKELISQHSKAQPRIIPVTNK